VGVNTTDAQTESPYAGYAAPEQQPPFGTYAALAAGFNALYVSGLVLARRKGRNLPETVSPQDVLLIGAASHKLSRLIAKDKVTAFVRAPFTEYQGRGGPAEVEERPRGEGLRRVFGEMLICPYCLGLWASGAFHIGLVFAPRWTRLAASTLTALTVSDFLQLAYKGTEETLTP
jgi:hypothetical protein